MKLETARECFLDMMARSVWSENTDGEIGSDGRYINRTSHTLIVSDRDLAILADALGIEGRIYETPAMSIKRWMRVAEAV